MLNLKNVVFKHSNREVADFIAKYKKTIYDACNQKGLPKADWDGVVNEVALKYACGKLKYDKSKKTKDTTFVFTVAAREAIDAWKSYQPHIFTATAPEKLPGKIVPKDKLSREEVRLLVNEALNRLAANHTPGQMDVFIGYVIYGKPVDFVAKVCNVRPNYVSQIKGRLLPEFQRLVKTILEEDEKGLYRKKAAREFIPKGGLSF